MLYGDDLREELLRTLMCLADEDDRAYSVPEILTGMRLGYYRSGDASRKLGELQAAGLAWRFPGRPAGWSASEHPANLARPAPLRRRRRVIQEAPASRPRSRLRSGSQGMTSRA